jgi:hypothetical protein
VAGKPIKEPNFWHVALSTIAAAFGVQSKRNQERDFQSGNIYVYITAGVIFTILFIVGISLIVTFVLRSSGIN